MKKVIKNNDISKYIKHLRLIGKHSTLIGLSMIVSYFISLYLKDKWEYYYSSLQIGDFFNLIWLLIGLLIFITGIIYLESFSSEKSFKEYADFWKFILEIILKIIPYSILVTVITIYIGSPLFGESPNWITDEFYRIIIINAIAIYITLIICVKIISNIYGIFKNSITDEKDRLTIVITIFATIISAIALLK